MGFTHLECHSHFTLLAATPSVAELAARAASDGFSHLALTDTNALYGVVSFARACRAAGIQPIVGMTLSVARPTDGATLDVPTMDRSGQLVLLARDASGYRSLCRLSSIIQSSPDREALAARGLGWEEIATHRTGLICLSGGRQGWIERFLATSNRRAAQAYAAKLAGIFQENAYLAVEIHRSDDESRAIEVAELGQRLGLPAVAVHPVYCLERVHASRLALLAAIRENRRLDSPSSGDDVTRLLSETPVWMSPSEMADRFAGLPDAYAQVTRIAELCGDALPDGRAIWPALQLPNNQGPDAALAVLAERGFLNHYAIDAPPAASGVMAQRATPSPGERLAHELEVIQRHGYAPLFLIVADIVRFARQRGIPVSTRGSVANSLVAYCTGITTVDPIEHGLLFERFLSPARANPPDIDLDFCSRRRDEVLAYVRDTYGADHVALISTVSTLRPQSAVREVGKAYGLSEAEVSGLAQMMPHRWHPDPRRRDNRTLTEVLAGIADGRHRQVVTSSWEMLGQPDHLGVHPGGLVITPGPLTDVVPVQWASKGFLVTQFEHGDVEEIGLPKVDLLGIRALTVLADAADLIRRLRAPDFRLETIPKQDAATGELLARGETIGVFQCESDGAQRTLRKLKAREVRDLAIANAFFKPGPAMGGMAPAFVRRYRGQEAVSYLHPALRPILEPTKGVLIFQEQVLRIAHEIAGLTWAEADLIRRGMSHFDPERMDAVRDRFVSGCVRSAPDGPAFTASQAASLWEQILPFAGYGFNQGHATAYAEVSYRSAYLKAHYPAEFLCARLADQGGFHHQAVYMAEAVRMGIHVHPPHINCSNDEVTLVRALSDAGQADGSAHDRFFAGLGLVRDLRRASIQGIIAARSQGGTFTNLRDLLARVDLQPKEIEHLIRCGALDGLGEHRAALLAEADILGRRGGGAQLAFDFALPTIQPEGLAQRLMWEQELLGYPLSAHPLAVVANRLPAYIRLRELPVLRGQTLTTAGTRLPGWTGGPGFFVSDDETFVVVRTEHESHAPPPWRPLIIRGRWTTDEWGGGWLQADQVTLVA